MTHDGPVVLGGTITFKADIFDNGIRPSETFRYKWSDNALIPHIYEVSFFLSYSLFKIVYQYISKLDYQLNCKLCPKKKSFIKV